MSTADSSGSGEQGPGGAQGPGEQPQSTVAVARGRVPDFFIVGHAKSGTTALYSMLRRHPQIFMPDAKEPWFFAEELHERTPPRPEGTPKTLEQYVAWFAGAGAEQQVGEASPLYLWSHTAAERIAQVRPDARIVAILREPASFLRSLHMQFVQSYIEVENDFAKALALEDARRAGREIPRYTYWPQALLYSEHVRYVEQLRRYLAVFGRRAAARADLRRLPRGQRGDRPSGAELPRRRRRLPGAATGGQSDGARSLTAHARAAARRLRWPRAVLDRRQVGGQDGRPAARAARRGGDDCAAGCCMPSRRRPTR